MACALLPLVAILGAPPTVFTYQNTNNIDNAAPWKNSTQFVTYLGLFDSADECVTRCIEKSTSDNKCLSYTWQKPGTDNYDRTCYGRFNIPYWMPVATDGITSGMVVWDCDSHSDCSLNGKCISGSCHCNKGFTGPRCGQFDFKEANPKAGLQLVDDGEATSSWGGSVVTFNNDYYMIASEFANHCGVYSWVVNSKVSLSMTSDLSEPFKRVKYLDDVFSHEPNAIRTPEGKYVVWYSGYNRTSFPPCTACKDGATTGDCPGPQSPLFYTYMRVADSPLGPWSEPQKVIDENPRNVDTNFAAVVSANGSVVGMSRIPNDGGSKMHLVTSPHYTAIGQYKEHAYHLFPEVPIWYLEDPFLWNDCEGNYHAVFHRLSPTGPRGMDGTHAYSSDGINWTFSGLIFNDTVPMNDGSTTTFHTRERPHVILDPRDNCTVVAVTSGAIEKPTGDKCHTLLQPVNLR
eukprot:TRINITY_DN18891_c0_g1_i1.p1 TRINITY_DN18891_c0_g1~~TRINITY_DN18891_c0_g1_i1.p1  ORF type:complete len:480 (+),score=76.77 TRINITY_DN18891_c0_g1_i1:63-1442(+)